MKLKYLLTTLFVALLSFSSFSQDYYLGLRAGYSQSSLKGDGEPTFGLKNRQAFTFGFVHNVRFKESKLGFSIETGYVLKGARINSAVNDYRLHYLNAPLLLDIYATEKLKVSFGPEISFLAAARNRTSDSTSVTLKEIFDKRWEFSGTVGVSYALDFYAEIGARYNTSFSKSSFDAILNRDEEYNTYFQIFLMLKIAN